MRRWISIDQIIKSTSSSSSEQHLGEWSSYVTATRKSKSEVFIPNLSKNWKTRAKRFCDWEIRHGRAAITAVLGNRCRPPSRGKWWSGFSTWKFSILRMSLSDDTSRVYLLSIRVFSSGAFLFHLFHDFFFAAVRPYLHTRKRDPKTSLAEPSRRCSCERRQKEEKKTSLTIEYANAIGKKLCYGLVSF